MEINGHEEITGEEIDWACDTREEDTREEDTRSPEEQYIDAHNERIDL